MLFVVDDNCSSCKFSSKLDQPSKSGGGAANVSAMNMFKMMDKKGAVQTTGTDVNTKHKNAIIQVLAAECPSGVRRRFHSDQDREVSGLAHDLVAL